MSEVIGTMTNGGVITTDSIPYESEVSGSYTYQRYESTTDEQMLMRVFDDGTTIKSERALDTWANRATATYTPINQ